MTALLNIKDLIPITWTEDMFENLVLPMEEKQLLLALTRSHAKQNLKFDDFVIGKGCLTPESWKSLSKTD